MWKFQKFSHTAKIFRQFDLQYKLFSKIFNLTKFLQKNRGGKICKFPHCVSATQILLEINFGHLEAKNCHFDHMSMYEF